MTFLLVTWWIALAVIVSSLAAGAFLSTRNVLATPVTAGLREVILEELRQWYMALWQWGTHLVPHGRRAAQHLQRHTVRVGGLVLQWVFGKVPRKRGKSSSFYLKHIAEHQDTLRQRTEEKHGY